MIDRANHNGRGTLRFVLIYGLAVLSASLAFVVHLTLRTENVRLGYALDHERREATRLRAEINQWRLESASSRTPQALEDIARSERGMVEPDRVPTLVVGGATRAARLSGRAR